MSVILEAVLPKNNLLIRCFVDGNYTFYTNVDLYVVEDLRQFIMFFKSISIEKKYIVMTNIATILEAMDRIGPPAPIIADDLPF